MQHKSYSNEKTPLVVHNLKNCDSHLIFQEVEIFKFKINVTLKTIEKCMGLILGRNKRALITEINSVHFWNG